MPDKRSHRGAHPEDAELFAPAAWPALRAAVADLSWLLSRDYAGPSAVKVVGDRYNLTQRQRTAVMRCACSDAQLDLRRRNELPLCPRPDAAGRELLIDGYNVLTTVEAALGGAVLLAARDGCYRDMASMHGTYRKVEETLPAVELVGEVAAGLGFGACTWYLDSPVSNSGRLKAILLECAGRRGWPWRVEVVQNPDAELIQAGKAGAGVVATADSAVLDRCGPWLNLAREVVAARVPTAYLVDLS